MQDQKEINENIDPARAIYANRDEQHWAELEALCKKHDVDFSELLINYPAFIRRRELPRLLADYELFKHIVDLPGIVVELGVYLGAGLFTWSKLMETFCPGDRARKVIGFDNCSGYPEYNEKDGNPRPWIEDVVGRKEVSAEFLEKMVELHNRDNMIPGSERCRIIVGEIGKTVPEFAANTQGMRISLLYFDANLYEPTLTGLRELYPLVVPGGVVAFNGYGNVPWQGEGNALHDYFDEMGQAVPVLKKFPFSIHPNGYFLKP